MARLLDLSPELVVLIANQLDAHGLASLSGTSRYYHALVDPIRFRRAATSMSSRLFFWAATYGRLSVVQKLIEHGADVNRKNPHEFLPLKSSNGLFDPDDDPTEDLSDPCTALHYAAAKGHTAIVGLLLESGANLDAKGAGLCECGRRSSARGHLSVGRLWLARPPSWTPLHLAVCNGQNTIIRQLLRAGSSLDDPLFTALHYTAAYGSVEAVEIILEAKPSLLEKPDSRGFMPMAYAYHHGRFHDIMPYLKHKGADINALLSYSRRARSVNLLQDACISHAYRNVVELVRLGADIHHSNFPSSKTALHICCAEDLTAPRSFSDLIVARTTLKESKDLELEEYRLQAVRVLIEAGADVGARDAYGATPLYYAAGISAIPVATALIESGAGLSSYEGHRLLVSIADANTRPVRGNWDDQIRLFNYFVELGAEINYHNKNNHNNDNHNRMPLLHYLCKIAAQLVSKAGNNANVERAVNHIQDLMATSRVDLSLKDEHGKLAIEYALYRPDLADLFPIDHLREVLTPSDLIRIRDNATTGAWQPDHRPLLVPVLEFLQKIDSHFVCGKAETLYSVIIGGGEDGALHLLDRGAVTTYVSMAGENLLHLACRSRLDKVIRRLVNEGFHINQTTKTGDTPLSLYIDSVLQQSLGGMANWKKYAAVPFIISHGGEPHPIICSLPAERPSHDYEWHQRPLDRLISRGEHAMAKEILDLCPPPPPLAMDGDHCHGYSYLHRACSFAHKVPDLDFVRYFLSFETLDVNTKNAYGRTVLSEVIRSMTPTKPWTSPFYKPQPNHSNLFGSYSQLYSPLAHANDFLGCVKLLEDHGADWLMKCKSVDDFGEEFEITPAVELKQILDWRVNEDDEISRTGLEIIDSELADSDWNPDEMPPGSSPFIRGVGE